MSPRVSSEKFHNSPFSEETLTKLEIFQLYTREWLPVFLSKPEPLFPEIHLFDFCAGPGRDSNGNPGSPLRLINELKIYKNLPGFTKAKIFLHLYDANERAIALLLENIKQPATTIPGVNIEIDTVAFKEAFKKNLPIFMNKKAAKLVFIDQFGVGMVTDDIFKSLTDFPACDFLFFIASSTLNRFHDHQAIKQKISRPEDPYHVHRAVLDYFKQLLQRGSKYFLGAFSIKKAPNIYGLIFGSSHPLGIDKFLQVAWKKDSVTGEANFDIDRDKIVPGELYLDMEIMRPTKVSVFEEDLEKHLRDQTIEDESSVLRICYEHGVTPQHAERVLKKLKTEGFIKIDFRVPNVRRRSDPKRILYLKKS